MIKRQSKYNYAKLIFRDDLLYSDTVLDQFAEVKIKPKTFS